MPYKILIIEPDESHMKAIKKTLEYAPDEYHFRYLNSPVEVIEMIETEDVHVIISELDTPVLSGLEVFQMCENIAPEIQKILLTDASDMPGVLRMVNNVDVFRIIIKPCKMAEDIIVPINQALLKQEQKKKEKVYKTEYKTAIQSLDDKFQVLHRAFQKNEADFQMIYQIIASAFRGNLMEGNGEVEQECLVLFLQKIFWWFVNVNYSDCKEPAEHRQGFADTFHRPEEGKTAVFLQGGAENRISHVHRVFYSIYLLAGMYDSIYTHYDMEVSFQGDENNMELIFEVSLKACFDGDGRIEFQCTQQKERQYIVKIVKEILKNLVFYTEEMGEDQRGIFKITGVK